MSSILPSFFFDQTGCHCSANGYRVLSWSVKRERVDYAISWNPGSPCWKNNNQENRDPLHGEEHVKKLFSTAVIVNEDTHSNLVRGHCFTGEDTNIFHPWSLKLEGFFRKSTNISFYMVTNLFIYTTGSSHIIDDCSRAVCFCQSLIGL